MDSNSAFFPSMPQRCLQLEPYNEVCQYMKGLSHVAMGQFYEGIKAQTKVMLNDPLPGQKASPEYLKVKYLRGKSNSCRIIDSECLELQESCCLSLMLPVRQLSLREAGWLAPSPPLVSGGIWTRESPYLLKASLGLFWGFFFASSSHFLFLKLKNFTYAETMYFELNTTVIWVSLSCHISSKNTRMTRK